MDLLLEAGDQFAVGGHQRLLGFDLRHDGLLRGEGWEGDLKRAQYFCVNVRLVDSVRFDPEAKLLRVFRVQATIQILPHQFVLLVVEPDEIAGEHGTPSSPVDACFAYMDWAIGSVKKNVVWR